MTGKEAVLQAFDRLFDKAAAKLRIECNDEEKEEAKRHFAARFSAAFMLDVLEHLDKPAQALRQIAARLLPGGRLVVTVPAHPWLFGEHDRYLHHYRRYTARALERELLEGGFTVDALSPMNASLLPAAVAARGVEWLRQRLAPRREARPRGMSVPPLPINRALAGLFGLERLWLPEHRLPFGLSLLAVATARR